MRVLLAFDKFKDALSARQACELTARALRGLHRDWILDLCPLTDGGEGFAEILPHAAAGQMVRFPVSGPRGGLIEAAFGLVPFEKILPQVREELGLDLQSSENESTERRVAVIEMAAASGLAHLRPELRNPWQTTTYGTGQLIRAAAELHVTAVLLGVGGSATNDLGLGALNALGMEFRTAAGEKVRPPFPSHWPAIVRLEEAVFSSIPPIRIACDVTNPLLGPRGAAAVYGPQKGLRPEDLPRLEHESARLAMMLCAHCAQSDRLMDIPGTGAAGGWPFGLMAAARAKILPGFDLVSRWLDLDARLAAADLVITGEGCFDETSLSGKGPGSLATRALALGKPVHIFAGQVGAAPRAQLALHPITPPDLPLAQALQEAPALLAEAVQRVFTAPM